tara:strand:+ start:1682 stop:2623 length:942 start_codon:yes stop_codon:yes gene_type:complete
MIDTLVFSSGGVGGISFIGCLKALEECGELENVRTMVGVSAGSMFACLIALQYTSDKIIQIVKDIDFNLLFHFDFDKLVNIDEELGLDKGDKLQSVIDLIIKHKTGSEHTTFEDLFEKTSINLVIGAVCINTKKMVFFSYENNPGMEIRTAIRMSCSIPVLFSPIKWEGKLYIDGGMLSRYPIQIPPVDQSQCGLGFFVRSKSDESVISEEESNFMTYLKQIMTLMYESSQKFENPNPNIHTVELSTPLDGYAPLTISNEEKDKIIAIGFSKTKEKIIELRLNHYNKIITAHKKIEECIKRKRVLGARFIRNL